MWPFGRGAKTTAPQHISTWPASLWKPRGDHSLEGSEAVFGAVTLLSNTIASMDIQLLRGHEEATDHPLSELLRCRPNPRMDAFVFKQTMEACRDTSGNCYALKVRAPDGSVTALDILDPSSVDVQRDINTGDLWYVLRPSTGGTFYVSATEIIHCRHIGAGGDKGVSPIAVLADTLDYDDQMKTFSVDQVKGVNGAVVLEFPSNMGDTQTKSVIDMFMENYKRSNGSLLVVSGGVKTTTIAKSPVDAKVLDVDRITANKVARVYNIPPSLLGDYSKTGYNSQEQQQMEYLERTIIPIVRMYEAQLNLKLLTIEERRQGYHFRFDLSGLVAADQLSRSQMLQYMIRNGMRTPNEARAREGMPPLPGGDKLFISKDLTPLEYLADHPETN